MPIKELVLVFIALGIVAYRIRIPETRKTFCMWQSQCGDTIQWLDWKNMQVVGWVSRFPKRGDFLRCKMQSGKILLLEFASVERYRSPSDMFVGTMKPIKFETNEKGEDK